MCWNCRGVMSATPYLVDCLVRYNIDVCGISEHHLRLYNSTFLNTIDSNYSAFTKCATERDPTLYRNSNKGGVALLIRNNLIHVTSLLEIDSDRITGVEVILNDLTILYIFCVYLPSSNLSDCLFHEYLEMLEELYMAYSLHGTVIIIGDMNVKIAGPKYSFTSDKRSDSFKRFISKYNLLSVNVQWFCKGPVHTHESYTGGPTSALDHILVPSELIPYVIYAKVDNECSLQLSDHKPVVCSISAITSPHSQSAKKEKPSWEIARRRNILSDYTFAVSHMLWPLTIPNQSATDIEIVTFYQKIVNTLKDAALETIPTVKFNKHTKPYWTTAVKECHSEMSYRRRLWLTDGRPRGMQFTSFRMYKKAKDKFRISLKKAYLKHETEIYSTLDEACNLNERSLWARLRNKKKNSSLVSLNVDGNIITHPEAICNAMADHFSDVFSDTTEEHFDDDYKSYLEEKVSDFKRNAITSSEEFCITASLVKKICSSLPNNKSCGMDEISYEHVKYGGSYLMFCLARLFSLIINNNCLPNDWHLGVLVCIFKGHNKSRLNRDSYRGITLLPVIFKIFERVLDSLMPQLQTNAVYPNNHQCGFQRGLSSLDTSFVVQETINHYKERSDCVSVAFLDSSKAFDTVWHTGLMFKLSQIGISPKIWMVLDNIYSNANSRVLVNNIYSRNFRQFRGLCQGSILSPKLYVLYINELLDMLNKSKKGSMILDIHISCPTQADDIALISPSPRNIQDMLLICQNYSSKWRFTFSSQKSQVINFGKKHDPLFFLYDKQLPNTTSVKHVGISLQKDLDHWDRTVEACKTMKSTSMALLHSGCHPCGLSPITSIKLVKVLCLSKSLYGCELWNSLSRNEVLALERSYRFAIKNLQGLPKRTRTDICLGLIGTTSVEAIIDIRKLYYLGHLLRTPTWSLVHKVITSRLFCFKNNCVRISTGFIADIHNIMCKYQLISYLTDFCETSRFPSKHAWKHIVKKSVFDFEESKWQTQISSSPDTSHFLQLHPSLKVHKAWQISRLNPLLKEHSHHVISICASWRPFTCEGVCSLCRSRYSDLLIHVICNCQYISKIRDEFWMSLLSIGPIELSVTLHNLPDYLFVTKLLSCEPPIDVDDTLDNIYSESVIYYIHSQSKHYFEAINSLS